jgi:formylglycine-generating enzyme required for sulfatase activity
MKLTKTLSMAVALVAAFVALSAPTAKAGVGTHGGIGMSCKNANGALSSVELLYLVEGRELYGFAIANSGASVDEQITGALAKLPDEAFRKYFTREIQKIRNEQRVIDAKYILVPTGDYSTPIIPKNCDLVQIAIYYGRESKVLLNQDLFNMLGNADKAALYIHEAAYKLFRDATKATSSDEARQLVGALFAQGDQSVIVNQLLAPVRKFVMSVEFVNLPLDLSFVSIPAGTFQMGSPWKEAGRHRYEKLHTVTLTRDFEMQTTTITQGQWYKVMKANPSYFKERKYCPEDYIEVNGTSLCPNNPVEQVSWDDTQAFIHRLNRTQDGYFYRLPTEAEWEYAARAKTQTVYYFGNNANVLGDYAWFSDNSGGQTHAVATKLPNDFGLYDMHGNVWQWVQDYYRSFKKRDVIDPSGPSSGSYRVLRGGGWNRGARHLRAALRINYDPSYRYRIVGARLVRTAAPQR